MEIKPIAGTPKSNQHKEQRAKKAIKDFVKKIKQLPKERHGIFHLGTKNQWSHNINRTQANAEI